VILLAARSPAALHRFRANLASAATLLVLAETVIAAARTRDIANLDAAATMLIRLQAGITAAIAALGPAFANALFRAAFVVDARLAFALILALPLRAA
jgi:hypothetical protein